MSRYQFMTPTVYRFDRCTACGHVVQKELAERRDEFLLSVFNDPKELERLSGLTAMQHSIEDVDLGMLEVTDEEFE